VKHFRAINGVYPMFGEMAKVHPMRVQSSVESWARGRKSLLGNKSGTHRPPQNPRGSLS
jgi:hypothetical protein